MGKRAYARERGNFVNDTPLQLALRELREIYSNRIALAVMAAVGVAAGLTGPFSTFMMLDLPSRLVYWLLIVYGSYGAGTFGAVMAGKIFVPSGEPLWGRIAVSALGASLPVTVLVVALCAVFLPPFRDDILGNISWLYFYCLALCFALMVLMLGVIEPYLAGAGGSAAKAPPPILERLPHEIRGPLSHLSMADHYVEIFTTRGKAMVLMRLADAIKETGGAPGLRIHRSHWVAKDAVKAIRKIEGKTMIETKAGALLPVSRSYLPAVRADFSKFQ